MTKEEFAVLDSGDQQRFESGMKRSTTEGKLQWHRVADGPMLERWAKHLTKGASIYEQDRLPGQQPNWMKATGQAEYERFMESAYRHFMQWYYGNRDEDHAAAVYFNVNGAEYVRARRLVDAELLTGDFGVKQSA
jgi:hypothetical protein